MTNVTVFTTTTNGHWFLIGLIRAGVMPGLVIGLGSPANGMGDEYFSSEDFCKAREIPFYAASSYSLSNEENELKKLVGDDSLAFVAGWQRLVPHSVIQIFTRGAVGFHGSHRGIERGRGRSPQNWALILGADEFKLSCFWLDEQADSGDVLFTETINIAETDDIQSLHIKVALKSASMAKRLTSLENKESLGKRQSGPFEYLPARKPEDGYIDWSLTVEEIRNQVRALTHPYPGACTKIQGDDLLVVVWDCFILHSYLLPETWDIGEIVMIGPNGELVVGASNGCIVITRSNQSEKTLTLPKFFEVVMKRQVFRQIIERHQHKFPSLPLMRELEWEIE